MASSNYPTSLDTSSTVGSSSVPAGTDDLDGSPSHADRHQYLADAVVKIETKVGTGSSTAASNEVFLGTGSGTSEWSSDNPLTESLDKNSNTSPQGASISGSPQTITTEADVTNCTKTITTPRANMIYVVHAVFDVRIDSVGTSDTFLGVLSVDGSNQTRKAILSYDPSDSGEVIRMTVNQSWVVTLATAASHTIKLRAEHLAGSGTVRLFEHTNIDIVGTYG